MAMQRLLQIENEAQQQGANLLVQREGILPEQDHACREDFVRFWLARRQFGGPGTFGQADRRQRRDDEQGMEQLNHAKDSIHGAMSR